MPQVAQAQSAPSAGGATFRIALYGTDATRRNSPGTPAGLSITKGFSVLVSHRAYPAPSTRPCLSRLFYDTLEAIEIPITGPFFHAIFMNMECEASP
jgi:hypothetical protein